MSKGKEGAFIYADESGHSGKEIFIENSPFYYQGAVISVIASAAKQSSPVLITKARLGRHGLMTSR